MDGDVANVANLPVDSVADVGFSLSQVDVDQAFQFLWFISVGEVFIIALLVLIAGLVFGSIVTRKWTV